MTILRAWTGAVMAGLLAATGVAMAAEDLPAMPRTESGGAWLGDAGHYLTGQPRMHLLNASGAAFTVTLFRYNWPFEGHWNQRKLPVTLTGPGGETVVQTTVETDEGGATVSVPAGAPGVYTLAVRTHSLNYWHVRTSLPKAVVWTGPATGDASPYKGQWLSLAPAVPRTWYFFVPKGTAHFSLKTQSHGARTQREDQGLIVRSPRGQPVAALWDQGNPTVRDGEIIAGRDLQLEQEARIVVEPGSDGRFWSLEARLGGAHLWTDFPVALSGVPPYLAHAPELWFDPETGQSPDPLIYDDVPYVRTDMPPPEACVWPHWTYWMASPAIGDAASNEIHAPARIAFHNPENREADLVVSSYLLRGWRPGSADLRLSKADGEVLFAERATLDPDEGKPYRRRVRFQGVGLLDVADCERFWVYTYPAMRAVLIGEAIEAGRWSRFRLEAGTVRHWFFRVPEGTRRFEIRFKARHPQDVVALDVLAPDRLMGRLYGREGATAVEVPAGLDGHVWHVRLDVGDATRYLPAEGESRYAVIPVELDLQGVPGLLAPTWEQWFDPGAQSVGDTGVN